MSDDTLVSHPAEVSPKEVEFPHSEKTTNSYIFRRAEPGKSASRLERLILLVRGRVTTARLRQSILRYRWAIIAFGAFLLYTFGIVRPFSAAPTDPGADDVATAWNESISRLGLLPVFPPEEDFHVGDVWAVIAKTDEDVGQSERGENGNKSDPVTVSVIPEVELQPLLRKAVRIAHIDVRDLLAAAHQHQPIFSETKPQKSGQANSYDDPVEVAKEDQTGRIRLSLAAFPGVVIKHVTRTSGAIGSWLGGLKAGRDSLAIEELRIPVAETYGVSTPGAVAKLDAWCSDPNTEIFCTDVFVRRVLAFAVSDKVLATQNGHYVAKLQLRLVTRVFLTREVIHRLIRDNSEIATARASVSAIGKDLTSSEPSQAGNARLLEDVGVFSRNSGDSEIGIQQIFQRPVAFGFRSISIEIKPSVPPAEDVQ